MKTLGQHLKTVILIALLNILLIGTSTPANSAQTPEANNNCLRCHGMERLAYQDPKTGNLINLAIDKKKLPHATHGNQPCLSCHKGDFSEYPHDIARDKQANSCADCHQDKPELKKYRFDKIVVQFKKSVHHKKDPDNFNCYTCHDLHSWQLGRNSHEETADLVERSNGSCISCHEKNSQKKINTRTIESSHSWLPATSLHINSIRCVECHTPRISSVIHAIEPAVRAEKKCAFCHTKDSILLTKLYKYRLRESERNAGFINGVVMNDSYIIGMTRHPLLDGLGIMLIGATTLGVFAHGVGRWIASRRRKKNESR
ncbi:MAG: hypothetical protein HQL70_06325 [Magnetococcales bacterium]|nr:hypothetical protein [Magnetococcales bacterium]